MHGFASGDAHDIGAAVEREVVGLLRERGVPPLLMNGGEVVHLEAGAFETAPHGRAEAVGARVAPALCS